VKAPCPEMLRTGCALNEKQFGPFDFQ
jgi:hypothetical protein